MLGREANGTRDSSGAAAEALVEVVTEQGQRLETESTGDPGLARVFGEFGARVEGVRVAGETAW